MSRPGSLVSSTFSHSLKLNGGWAMSSPAVIGESKVLLSSLNAQRDHVIEILDGLPEEALRRRVLPSGGRAWAF